MAIQFNQSTTPYRGLVQMYELEIGANLGDVSGNALELAVLTSRMNNALDNYISIWASCAGTWQGDDINQTNYPIITASLIAGQRDYTFTTDGDSNRITEIQKVLILPSSTATQYIEISPVDELNTYASDILLNSNQGVPVQYGKLANGVFLDPVPSYSVATGIKMVVTREGSYFTISDTTKIAGIPSFHEYLYLKPAYEFASINGLSNLGALEKKVIDLEGSERLNVTGKIREFFSKREKDVRTVMTGKKIYYI